MPSRTKPGKPSGTKGKPPKGKPKDQKPVETPTTKPKQEREVLYPPKELRDQGILYQYEGCYGDKAITVEQSQAMLGWTEVGSKEGSHFTDRNGKHIYCEYNLTNREIKWAEVEKLVQVHLTHRYRFNGEDILIGMYGSVLNGQKSMIAHVLAEQDRLRDLEGARKWVRYWDGPITMEKGVKFGISEDDEVVDTLDTAQPRTLKDVMYRSEYLRTLPTEIRSAASKIADYAIRLTWARTGAGDIAFTKYGTHDAMKEFLSRHPGLIKAIKWMAEEDAEKVEFPNADGKVAKKGRVSLIIEPSRAAGLLYLMGMSATPSAVYRYAQPDPTEQVCDDTNWDKAEDFWTGLVGGSEDLKPVRTVLALLVDKDTGRPPTSDEKITVIWKAWTRFLKGQKLVPELLKPRYRPRLAGDPKVLVNEWDFGGIDLYHQIHPDEDAAPDKTKPTTGAPPTQGQPPNDEEEEEEELDSSDLEGEDEEGEEFSNANGQAPVGASESGETVLREPTPTEIRMMLGKNGAMEEETPEQERLRRERIEREDEARRERENEESKTVKIRRLKDVPPRR